MPDLSSTDAEYFYNKLRTGITDEQVPDRRLHSINFVDDGVRQIVQVGDEDFRGTGPVFAIYGPSHLRNLYFIVTLNAGLVNFDPYWVGATEVQGIESFLDE